MRALAQTQKNEELKVRFFQKGSKSIPKFISENFKKKWLENRASGLKAAGMPNAYN